MAPNTNPSGPDPTRAFYDRISHVYDLIADASEHAARDSGLVALGVSPGERVLEIGCGTGHALVSLARARPASRGPAKGWLRRVRRFDQSGASATSRQPGL